MKATLRRAKVLYVLLALFTAGIVFLAASLYLNGDKWASNRVNRHIYSNGQTVNSGTVYDRNGKILAESVDGERKFNADKNTRLATLHLVGDTSGFISTGTQSLFRDTLSGYTVWNGIRKLKTTGKGTDITLNVDAEACKIAYGALGNRNGTVGVYNYKTGELLCSVSKPTYDLNNVPPDLLTNGKFEGVFLDKFVSGIYTPGSIMKIVTAACAVENIPALDTLTFECKGEIQTGKGTVICNDKHGKISFRQALNKSCNCAFAEISLMLGADKLNATANALGFNTDLSANGIRLVKSRFAASDSNKTELGWAGVGQSTTLVNPCHFLAIAGAIANGGTGLAPNRIKSPQSLMEQAITGPQTLVTMSPATAQILCNLLRSNVTEHYGENAFPNLEMCGKTGTAELDDGKESHAWFAGFSMRADLPLAIICIVENGGSGRDTAIPVCNKVMQYFLNEGVK